MRNTLPNFFFKSMSISCIPPHMRKNISTIRWGSRSNRHSIRPSIPRGMQWCHYLWHGVSVRVYATTFYYILAIRVRNPYTRVCHWHIKSVVHSCSSQWRGLRGIVLCLQLVFSVTVASQNEIWQSWIIVAYTKKFCANLFLCLGNFSCLENIQASWFFCHQVGGYQNHTSKTFETKSKTIRPNRYFFVSWNFFLFGNTSRPKSDKPKGPFPQHVDSQLPSLYLHFAVNKLISLLVRDYIEGSSPEPSKC